ncbi:hypothetical protein [Leifsonia aquatica]|uniref:hypothetical protein n=1 Tax=Leifsonia aquatica TaxID=144185 RepID=UPI0038034D37
MFAFAAEEWRLLREEFELVREAAFALAQDETHGVMLNARGKRARIDPYSLFIGNHARAHAYASPELIEHWRSHPRPVFAQFERERFAPGGGYR